MDGNILILLVALIPVLITVIFYFIWKQEFTWWEFFIPIAAVLFVAMISKVIVANQSVMFTEYWGSTVISVFEEEPYNYWHSETCSEEYACGSDSDGNTEYCTRYYDCSHQEDVAPSWWAKTDIGESFGISEKQYDEINKQFGTKRISIDRHDNYDPSDRAVGSDGTKFQGTRVGKSSYTYQTSWNRNDDTRKAYTSVHTYENRIKATDLSIFNIPMVTKEQADSLGLYEYPEYKDGWFTMTNGLEYPTILGKNISKATQEKFKRLNGKFGKSNQARLWVLVFDNKPQSIATLQENYWVRGNKNELVVCIGRKGNEIMWSHSFSWANSDILTVGVKNRALDLYSYRDSTINRKLPQVIPVSKELKTKILGKMGEQLPDILPLPKQFNGDSIVTIKSKFPVLTEETWNDYYNYLNLNLKDFDRRSFKEFSYLKVKLPRGYIIFISIFAVVISLGINIWNINNDIRE